MSRGNRNQRFAPRTFDRGSDFEAPAAEGRDGLERVGFAAADCDGTYFLNADFQPPAGINRARRDVMFALQKVRLETEGQSRFEPTGEESFE